MITIQCTQKLLKEIGQWYTEAIIPTVLAYQAVQALRQKLKAKGINDSWTCLRERLSVQQRITATFKQRDGRTLHVRKATVAEPKLKKLYEALDISPTPGGVQKLID